MPLDEDKYPQETGRRRFVKGVVGSAALGSVTAAGGAAVTTATNRSGAGGGTTQYIGIELIDGPAPRGLPYIPVRINDNNELTGLWPESEEGDTGPVAQTDIGGTTYSTTWFQYCGVQQYPTVRPEKEADNRFASEPGTYDWQGEIDQGAPLTVSDFDDYQEWGNGIGTAGIGKPAMVKWRNNDEGRPLPVQVIRSPEVPKMINGEGKYSSLSSGVRSFIDAATEENFIAWLDKCTHFCCVPQGFKTTSDAGAEDLVYCQCHQSVYDPYSPTQLQFVALPRPE